ncbi:unnamed protein product [Amoebophrya sp. A25]|nr:unnamed protein product [Amoebophrya sp. A25]|eukprot:GSA25T00006813001.1
MNYDKAFHLDHKNYKALHHGRCSIKFFIKKMAFNMATFLQLVLLAQLLVLPDSVFGATLASYGPTLVPSRDHAVAPFAEKEREPTEICRYAYETWADQYCTNDVSPTSTQQYPILSADCKDTPGGCKKCYMWRRSYFETLYLGATCVNKNRCYFFGHEDSCQETALHLETLKAGFTSVIQKSPTAGYEDAKPVYLSDVTRADILGTMGVCRGPAYARRVVPLKISEQAPGEGPKINSALPVYPEYYRRWESKKPGTCGETASADKTKNALKGRDSSLGEHLYGINMNTGDYNIYDFLYPTGNTVSQVKPGTRERAVEHASDVCDRKDNCQGFYMTKELVGGFYGYFQYYTIEPPTPADAVTAVQPESTTSGEVGDPMAEVSCTEDEDWDLYLKAVGPFQCPEPAREIQVGSTERSWDSGTRRYGCGPAYHNRVCMGDKPYCKEAEGYCVESLGAGGVGGVSAEAVTDAGDYGLTNATKYTRAGLWDRQRYPGNCRPDNRSRQPLKREMSVLVYGKCNKFHPTENREVVERHPAPPYSTGVQTPCEGDMPACSNTCPAAHNGICEDGGPGSTGVPKDAALGVWEPSWKATFHDHKNAQGGVQSGSLRYRCPLGTDCADCGVRENVWRRILHSRHEKEDPDPVNSRASLNQEIRNIFEPSAALTGGSAYPLGAGPPGYYARVRMCRGTAAMSAQYPHLEGRFPGDCVETFATMNVRQHLGGGRKGLTSGVRQTGSLCRLQDCLPEHPRLHVLNVGLKPDDYYYSPVYQWRHTGAGWGSTGTSQSLKTLEALEFERKPDHDAANAVDALADGIYHAYGNGKKLHVHFDSVHGSGKTCDGVTNGNTAPGFAQSHWGNGADDACAPFSIYVSCTRPRASGEVFHPDLAGPKMYHQVAAIVRSASTAPVATAPLAIYQLVFPASLYTFANGCRTESSLSWLNTAVAPRMAEGFYNFVKAQVGPWGNGAHQVLSKTTVLQEGHFNVIMKSCENVKADPSFPWQEFALQVGPFYDEADALTVKRIIDQTSESSERLWLQLELKKALQDKIDAGALGWLGGNVGRNGNERFLFENSRADSGRTPKIAILPLDSAHATYNPSEVEASLKTSNSSTTFELHFGYLQLYADRLPSRLCAKSGGLADETLGKVFAKALHAFVKEMTLATSDVKYTTTSNSGGVSSDASRRFSIVNTYKETSYHANAAGYLTASHFILDPTEAYCNDFRLQYRKGRIVGLRSKEDAAPIQKLFQDMFGHPNTAMRERLTYHFDNFLTLNDAAGSLLSSEQKTQVLTSSSFPEGMYDTHSAQALKPTDTRTGEPASVKIVQIDPTTTTTSTTSTSTSNTDSTTLRPSVSVVTSMKLGFPGLSMFTTRQIETLKRESASAVFVDYCFSMAGIGMYKQDAAAGLTIPATLLPEEEESMRRKVLACLNSCGSTWGPRGTYTGALCAGVSRSSCQKVSLDCPVARVRSRKRSLLDTRGEEQAIGFGFEEESYSSPDVVEEGATFPLSRELQLTTSSGTSSSSSGSGQATYQIQAVYPVPTATTSQAIASLVSDTMTTRATATGVAVAQSVNSALTAQYVADSAANVGGASAGVLRLIMSPVVTLEEARVEDTPEGVTNLDDFLRITTTRAPFVTINPPPSESEDSGDDGDANMVMLIGIIAGGVAFLGLVVAGIAAYLQAKKTSPSTTRKPATTASPARTSGGRGGEKLGDNSLEIGGNLSAATPRKHSVPATARKGKSAVPAGKGGVLGRNKQQDNLGESRKESSRMKSRATGPPREQEEPQAQAGRVEPRRTGSAKASRTDVVERDGSWTEPVVAAEHPVSGGGPVSTKRNGSKRAVKSIKMKGMPLLASLSPSQAPAREDKKDREEGALETSAQEGVADLDEEQRVGVEVQSVEVVVEQQEQ